MCLRCASVCVYRTKLELCQAVGASVLVDDSLKYVKECSGKLPTVILFGDYAWNSLPEGEGLPQGTLRAHNWVQLRGMLSRVDRTGRVKAQDAVICTLKHKAEFYANSVRWLLENQEEVNITGVGSAIASVVRAQANLERVGDVTVLSTRSGLDAAPPQKERMPRLTVKVKRRPDLLKKLAKITREAPRFRAARAQVEATKAAGNIPLGDTSQPTLGNTGSSKLPPATQVDTVSSTTAEFVEGAAAAAHEAARRH